MHPANAHGCATPATGTPVSSTVVGCPRATAGGGAGDTRRTVARVRPRGAPPAYTRTPGTRPLRARRRPSRAAFARSPVGTTSPRALSFGYAQGVVIFPG